MLAPSAISHHAEFNRAFHMETHPALSPSVDGVDSATRLYNDIRAVFPKAVAEFESRWAAALHALSSSSVAEDGDACTRTEEFDALKRLGPKIIPFVVFKLATDDDGQNLWSVLLCKVSMSCLLRYPAKSSQTMLSRTTLTTSASQAQTRISSRAAVKLLN